MLFHSDNRRFAVQVDEIIGTKEIVVKTLGSQFSSVPGLGGATILSDGQVVVIIDLNELARVSIVDLPRVGQGAERGLEHESRSTSEVSTEYIGGGRFGDGDEKSPAVFCGAKAIEC